MSFTAATQWFYKLLGTEFLISHTFQCNHYDYIDCTENCAFSYFLWQKSLFKMNIQEEVQGWLMV